MAWLPGGAEFVYVRMVAADEVPEGEQAFHRRVWRHRVGTPTSEDRLIDAIDGLGFTAHAFAGETADGGRSESRRLVLARPPPCTH